MVIGEGNSQIPLSRERIEELLREALDLLPLANKKVLVIIPDGSRPAPLPLIFSILYKLIGAKIDKLDYLIALGTHAPMSEEAIGVHIGIPVSEMSKKFPKVNIYNHQWNSADAITTLGIIPAQVVGTLSEGLFREEIPVRLNKLILDYDQLIICGPVLPHGGVGYSGGTKYLFPGIAGPEIIDTTHWLAAFATANGTIGKKDTPARRVIDWAATFVKKPILHIALCMEGRELYGLYAGDVLEAWEAGVGLSQKINIEEYPCRFNTVLAATPKEYDEFWTAAKASPALEQIVADGGELIIYNPKLTTISYTHGEAILKVGYHVLDFFTKQWDSYKDFSLNVLSHSALVRGPGVFETGVEKPRIKLTLATGLPKDICSKINLGYLDPESINIQEFKNREDENILLVEDAGRKLYRIMEPTPAR